MSWMIIVRRILMSWYEIIVDRWWGWCMESVRFRHLTFHTDMNISYEYNFFFIAWILTMNKYFLWFLFNTCICIRILRSLLIFVWECLAVDLSMSHLIWYDMIWYDITHNNIILVCQYVIWETLLSTYLSSNTIIDSTIMAVTVIFTSGR